MEPERSTGEDLEATAPSITESENCERLLTSAETARRLAVTIDWLFRHGKSLPFRVELTVPANRGKQKAHQVRYSERGLSKWIAALEAKQRRR